MTDIHHDLIEAVSGQLLHQVLHNRFAQNRDHWFGHLVRQWPDPGTLTGSKNHCLHKLNRQARIPQILLPLGSATKSRMTERLHD